MYKKSSIICIVFIFILATCGNTPSNDFVGTWKIIKIDQKTSDGSIANLVYSSIFIFTPTHYSMAWVTRSPSQSKFADRWNPTDKEKIGCYDALVINSGTYELTDSTWTASPIIARVPEFIGGKLICNYQVVGDTLTLELIDEYAFDGIQAPWVASGEGLRLTLIRMKSD